MEVQILIIYVDGSCSGNPGPGGYAVITLNDNEQIISTYRHSEPQTTNNRQELKAILYAMIHYGRQIPYPTVYSDSAYAINTFTSWMFTWAKNNWRKSKNQIPENLDLIQTYYDLYQKGYHINLQKIKGHNGEKWNEMADKMAKGEKVNVEK